MGSVGWVSNLPAAQPLGRVTDHRAPSGRGGRGQRLETDPTILSTNTSVVGLAFGTIGGVKIGLVGPARPMAPPLPNGVKRRQCRRSLRERAPVSPRDAMCPRGTLGVRA